MRSDNTSDNTFRAATLVEILRDRSIHQPDQIAYTFWVNDCEEVHITYRELAQRAQSIAAQLQACCAPGDRALLLYAPSLEYIAAFLGCLWAGIIAVPAYPPERDRASRIQAILADAQPQIALTSEAILARLTSKLLPSELGMLKWLATDDLRSVGHRPIKSDPPPYDPPDPNPETAFLQYTSGSTGTPKGVMVSHANLLHNLGAIQRAFGHTAQSRGVIWLPPYHDMGLIGGILQPLYVGFPVTLMSPLTFMQSPLRWLQAISRDRATTSGAPNFAYDLCVRSFKAQLADYDLSSWEVAFNGAEPIQPQTLERFATTFEPFGFRRSAFYPCYGLAEATLIVAGSSTIATKTVKKSALPQNQAMTTDPDDQDAYSLVSCGHGLSDQQIRIVDPATLTLCKASQIGEIWVSGASVAQGYWHQPEATDRTFRAQIKGSTQPFLRTGDLGFLDAGELFVTGRLKDLIIIRGRNHYPQDIEQTVQASHPALSLGNGAAFSVEIEGAEQLVIVQEVERRSLPQLDIDAVCRSIVQAVSEQHELQVYAIDLLKPKSLPKTSSGKLQRSAYRASFLTETLEKIARWRTLAEPVPPVAPVSSAEPVPPAAVAARSSPRAEDEIQAWLVAHLSLYLKVDEEAIDVSLPFAYYGLDSSVAVSITSELAEWLGLEQLDPTLFWEYPSIEALAQHLGTNV